MSISVLIVEDEFTIAMDIEQRLIAMGFSVVGIAVNYDEALPLLIDGGIDLVLLDINLEEEKSGIDLGKLISEKFTIPTLFLTAYTDNETFEKASAANPMGYLNKPFKDSDLAHGIKLAVQRFEQLNGKTIVDVSLDQNSQSNSLFIKDKGKLNKVNIQDIIWIEAMDNYTIVHLKSSKYVANTFLKDMLGILGNDFVRIHRSHAVAIDKITSIDENLVFVGDLFITISKSYKSDLMKRLNLV
jgi:DNA-binding LytR/AlgR family response regulator